MSELTVDTHLIGDHTVYLDWSGKLQQGGRVSSDAVCAIAVNLYDGETIVGSLVYEEYDEDAGWMLADGFPGPYFHDQGDGFLLVHTIYVDEAYRGQGLMRRLLEPVVDRWLPVYVNRWQNKELGVFFDRRFQPDDRWAERRS